MEGKTDEKPSLLFMMIRKIPPCDHTLTFWELGLQLEMANFTLGFAESFLFPGQKAKSTGM